MQHKNKAFIGVYSSFIAKNIYFLKCVPISPELICITNHGEWPVIYSVKKNKIIKELDDGLPLTIINQAHSQKYKAIFFQLSDHTFSVFS